MKKMSVAIISSIYSNLYGFNVVTDYDLPAMESYKADMILPQLPTLKVRVKKQLDNRIADGIRAESGSVKVTYSSTMNYAEVDGKYDVEITAEGIQFSDSVSNAEYIYAEITGSSIIMASRFHNRAVLHGSAFLYKNKAYLIIALSGSGKSTLTSALVKYQQIDYMFIPLKGFSMEPLFFDGDVLTVQKKDRYEVSEIIMFRYRQEGYLVHRIMEIDEDNGVISCKGDNARRRERIFSGQIVGKVIHADRKGVCIYEA